MKPDAGIHFCVYDNGVTRLLTYVPDLSNWKVVGGFWGRLVYAQKHHGVSAREVPGPKVDKPFVCDGTCAGNELGDCNHGEANDGLGGRRR